MDTPETQLLEAPSRENLGREIGHGASLSLSLSLTLSLEGQLSLPRLHRTKESRNWNSAESLPPFIGAGQWLGDAALGDAASKVGRNTNK